MHVGYVVTTGVTNIYCISAAYIAVQLYVVSGTIKFKETHMYSFKLFNIQHGDYIKDITAWYIHLVKASELHRAISTWTLVGQIIERKENQKLNIKESRDY